MRVVFAVVMSLGVGAARVHAQQAPADTVVAARAQRAAKTAAEAWLNLVDHTKYADSYAQASPEFKAVAKSPQQWQQLLTAARDSLGTLKARKLMRAGYTRRLPNSPEGEYVILQYMASFAGAPQAVETVSAKKDTAGKWRVLGYFVRRLEQ